MLTVKCTVKRKIIIKKKWFFIECCLYKIISLIFIKIIVFKIFYIYFQNESKTYSLYKILHLKFNIILYKFIEIINFTLQITFFFFIQIFIWLNKFKILIFKILNFLFPKKNVRKLKINNLHSSCIIWI